MSVQFILFFCFFIAVIVVVKVLQFSYYWTAHISEKHIFQNPMNMDLDEQVLGEKYILMSMYRQALDDVTMTSHDIFYKRAFNNAIYMKLDQQVLDQKNRALLLIYIFTFMIITIAAVAAAVLQLFSFLLLLEFENV